MDKRQLISIAGLEGTQGWGRLMLIGPGWEHPHPGSYYHSRLLEGINKLSGLVNGGLHVSD